MYFPLPLCFLLKVDYRQWAVDVFSSTWVSVGLNGEGAKEDGCGGEGQMDTYWQVDTFQAWWFSETIYQAALNHSQEIGAASVIQVSRLREVNMFRVTASVLDFRDSLFWGSRGGVHGLWTP